jgi:archaeal chaperonin
LPQLQFCPNVALKYADALESILLTLAGNGEMEMIDVKVELRAKYAQNKTWFGVHAHTGTVEDMMDAVVEPLAAKEEIVRAATEASCMILRIDDVLASGKMRAPAGPPPGAGGMDGYGGVVD